MKQFSGQVAILIGTRNCNIQSWIGPKKSISQNLILDVHLFTLSLTQGNDKEEGKKKKTCKIISSVWFHTVMLILRTIQ